MKARNLTVRPLALVLTLLMALPWESFAQATSPVLPDPGRPGMNRQQQEQLGLQAAGEVYQQMPVLPDSSPATRYVQELGRKLQTVIPADNSWPYQFHVVPAADINAFALPGGPIFVNLGTIQAADNEAELAGVLAHEMSHVYMQHSAKQAPKAAVAQIFAGLAGAVLGGSAAGNLARMGIQFGAGTMLMKYSRKDEAQADSVGAIIMYKAGYNPKAMADFFTKLEQKYGNGGPQLLSDHPNPGNRQASIQKEIAPWPSKSYTNGNTNAFANAKQFAGSQKTYTAQEIDAGAKQKIWAQQNQKNGALGPSTPKGLEPSGGNGQAPGESQPSSSGSPSSGGLTNISYKQVAPSERFTQFQQSGLTISYPDNWKSAGDQSSITIAPQEAIAQNGIAYGVIISGAKVDASELDQATDQLVQQLQKDNAGMKIFSSPTGIQVNGQQGRSTVLSATSPIQHNGQPVPERDWLITFPSPKGDLMYLVFVAPEQEFAQIKPTYQKMLESFQLK
jgi:beta-barrel assembly-enhancing protease